MGQWEGMDSKEHPQLGERKGCRVSVEWFQDKGGDLRFIEGPEVRKRDIFQ